MLVHCETQYIKQACSHPQNCSPTFQPNVKKLWHIDLVYFFDDIFKLVQLENIFRDYPTFNYL